MTRTVEMERPLTLDGAADVLGCSRRWLQGWLSTNTEHGYKIGREWRFMATDIISMREAMKCPSKSSKTGKTLMVLGTSEGLSGAAALKKALELATKSGRRNSKRAGRQNSSTKQSTVVPLSRRSRTPRLVISSSEGKDAS